MEYHINLHMKLSKMKKCNNGLNKINVRMTSVYNKLWKKEDQLCVLFQLVVSHICITKIIKFKRHTSHLISSINCDCSITIFSSFIFFYNVNNNFKKFYELQICLKSYIHLAKQWSYVEFSLFGNKFTIKTTYDLRNIEFKLVLSLKLNKN